MQWFKLRPTFEIALPIDREQAIERLKTAFRKHGDHHSFLMHGEYGEIHLPPETHRLWSPHLSFYLEDQGGHAVAHGRFAPRVQIWTVVWIAYLAMAFTSFFGLMLAYSQWRLSEPAWGVWVGGGALVIILVIYVVAHVGQQWSVDQMLELRSRLEVLLNDAARPRAGEAPQPLAGSAARAAEGSV